MSQSTNEQVPSPTLKLKNFASIEKAGLDIKDARIALEKIIQSIPDEELKNFRGVQVTVIK